MQLVVLAQGCDLDFIDTHTGGDGLFVVIRTAANLPTAFVTDALHSRRIGKNVVHLAAGLTDAAPLEALHEGVGVTIQL